MPTRIQLRRGTASEWTDANPTLAEGEPGFETDTGLIKIGDGSTVWTSLDYFIVARAPWIFGTEATPEGVVVGYIGQGYKNTSTGDAWLKASGNGTANGWV